MVPHRLAALRPILLVHLAVVAHLGSLGIVDPFHHTVVLGHAGDFDPLVTSVSGLIITSGDRDLGRISDGLVEHQRRKPARVQRRSVLAGIGHAAQRRSCTSFYTSIRSSIQLCTLYNATAN